MLTIAIKTTLSYLVSCSETHKMTRNGWQIIVGPEAFFVSEDRFLSKYKGNLYIVPGTKDRLLTFEEADALRASVMNLEGHRIIKVKGSNKSELFDKSGATYNLFLASSDVEVAADDIRCEYNGNNSNIKVTTSGSVLDMTSSNSRFDIRADNTVITMYISNCFVELDGSNLEVMIIGSNNNISGIAEGITVFARGKKNEFHNRDEAPEADPSKNDN